MQERPWHKEADDLYKQGYSGRKIADILGMSKTQVNDYLRYAFRSEERASEAFLRAREGNHIALANKRSSGPRILVYDIPIENRVARRDDGDEDNSRILLISDLHIPYHHRDSIEFLQHLKDKYVPTRVICMGDELDKHALSYHDHDPDLPSAGDELRKSIPVIKELFKMFPKMDVIESNHGSLVWRKAKTHGIPRHYLKSYNEVLGVDEGWRWSFDLTITLPNGQRCYFHHGKSSDVLRLSQQMGMNAVQGHYHEKFKIDYWGNPNGLFWGLQTGCLIDDESLAFSYNNVNIKRPIIGTAVIVDSQPILEPMVLNKHGRWVGAGK